MRITNNIIVGNTKSNMNANKILVDKYNTQMTTQKKISKPSDNPVIAIRSLRLSTNLSKLNQYADNNIPDAEAWLDVTQTALINMKDILTDIRTQCVNGSTDTLVADDRNVILENLQRLADQVYYEGNADYAGRTVFTGYRTTEKLTFQTDEKQTKYQIDQKLNYEDFEEHRYYYGNVEVPSDASTSCTEKVGENTYYRLRLAYDNIDSIDSIAMKDSGGNAINQYGMTEYESEEAWIAAGQPIADDGIVFLKNSGDLVFGKDAYTNLKSGKAEFDITYTKTGFVSGEPRPEYYYDCRDISDANNVITYTKEDQTIDFTIAANTTLTVNTQASDVFDTSIIRDVNELITIVQKAITANDKVTQIKSMMKEAQYSDADSQEKLQSYLDAAQKEADYADDNLQKTYGQYITNFDGYLQNVNLAITNLGSTIKRLELTQNRVENQQTTMEELKSTNEDRDISDIIIDYYASYNAYTASLTAAGRIGEQTLLNYL